MTDVDVVVVGAGFAGLYMLHKLREIGMTARAFETGDGVGGTWYWNRYPGARCDVESIDYTYSFSEELQREWRWSERYPAQPEILRYLNFVADKFDLRRDITFETRVESAVFDEASATWLVTTSQGDAVRCRFCVMATGCLSTPKRPGLDGAEVFEGETYHTGLWPHEGVDFTGKRVGVIGTGSSAIQSIPQIAKQAAHLTVFQRTPNFSIPAHNGPIDHEREAWSDEHFAEFREVARASGFGSSNLLNPQSALQATPEEREAMFQSRWETGGVAFLGSYMDLLFNEEANQMAADFVRAKIKETVHDPEVAESLAPKDHPFGSKRLCVDIDYFETYNRPNVTLVDLKRTPLVGFTPRGIRTTAGEHEVDAIVFATGLRRDDRRVAQHRHPGSRRRVDARRMGRRPAHLPRDHGGGVPEPLHDHGPGQSVGAQQHGHLDRAARRLARRPVHAHERARRSTASRRTPTRKTPGEPTSSTSRT